MTPFVRFEKIGNHPQTGKQKSHFIFPTLYILRRLNVGKPDYVNMIQ